MFYTVKCVPRKIIAAAIAIAIAIVIAIIIIVIFIVFIIIINIIIIIINFLKIARAHIRLLIYYINTSEIPSEFSRKNFISSHVKRSPSLWLHNISRLFHWCLYNEQNITCLLVDMNFIFSFSTQYLIISLRSLVRYRVEHSKIKFISTRGYVILYLLCN